MLRQKIDQLQSATARFCGLWIACCVTLTVAAQDLPDKNFEAVRTQSPPMIDGELNDPAWLNASILTDFVDTRLDSVAPQEHQTIARVLYDDEYIYIGAELMQDPETIVSTVRKYDRFALRFEDYFQVGLDTFFSQKEAYLFLVSPLGVRWDARDSVFGRNESWDAEWDVETRILEDRWIAEMRIPIGVMHHSREDDVTWGFNFRRQKRQDNVPTHWNYDPGAGVPRRVSGPKFIADFGQMTGLDLANSVVRPAAEYETYASTTVTRQQGDVDTKFATGADVALRISPNLITSFTVNPDFGQVESDSDTIELRDTERFLAERRTFFNEGAELLRGPVNIYNSRRIVDIKAGAKISGNGKRWTMAALDVQGDSEASGDSNFLVTRGTFNVTDDIQVGGMWVSSVSGERFNVVFGPDVRVDISPTTTWTTQFLQEFEEDTDAIDGDGNHFDDTKSEHSFYTELSGGSEPFFWELEFEKITEEFDPDLAFIQRQDVIGPTVDLSYTQEVEAGVLEGYDGNFEVQYYKNHSGNTVLRDYSFFGGLEFRRNIDVRVFASDDYHAPYNNNNIGTRIDYNRQNRLKSMSATFSGGEFEEVPFKQVDIQKPFGIGNRFTGELTGSLREEDPDFEDDETIWLARLVTEYTFAWEGRVKLTLEQTSEDRYNRTLLFAYEDVGNWDFYFVLNDILSSDIVTRGFFTKVVYRF